MEPATMSDLKDLMKELREELRESIKEAVAEAFGNSKPALEHATTSTASQLLAMDAFDAKASTRACSSHDQGTSALYLTPTATIDILPELDIDATDVAAPTPTICLTDGLNHSADGNDHMVAWQAAWSTPTYFTVPPGDSPIPSSEPALGLALGALAQAKCSTEGSEVIANSMVPTSALRHWLQRVPPRPPDPWKFFWGKHGFLLSGNNNLDAQICPSPNESLCRVWKSKEVNLSCLFHWMYAWQWLVHWLVYGVELRPIPWPSFPIGVPSDFCYSSMAIWEAHVTNSVYDIHLWKFMEHPFLIVQVHGIRLTSSSLPKQLFHTTDRMNNTWERWYNLLGHSIRILPGQLLCLGFLKQDNEDSVFSEYVKLFHGSKPWFSELCACSITIAFEQHHSCLATVVMHRFQRVKKLGALTTELSSSTDIQLAQFEQLLSSAPASITVQWPLTCGKLPSQHVVFPVVLLYGLVYCTATSSHLVGSEKSNIHVSRSFLDSGNFLQTCFFLGMMCSTRYQNTKHLIHQDIHTSISMVQGKNLFSGDELGLAWALVEHSVFVDNLLVIPSMVWHARCLQFEIDRPYECWAFFHPNFAWYPYTHDWIVHKLMVVTGVVPLNSVPISSKETRTWTGANVWTCNSCHLALFYHNRVSYGLAARVRKRPGTITIDVLVQSGCIPFPIGAVLSSKQMGFGTTARNLLLLQIICSCFPCHILSGLSRQVSEPDGRSRVADCHAIVHPMALYLHQLCHTEIVQICKANISTRSAMRGPGEVQGSYVAEALIEHVASALSTDATLVRQRNIHTAESLTLFHSELSQGLWTKVKQMAAFGLGQLWADRSQDLLERVRVIQADTLSVVQGGWTTGSTSSECSCEAVRLACNIMVDRLKSLMEQLQEKQGKVSCDGLISQTKMAGMAISTCPDQEHFQGGRDVIAVAGIFEQGYVDHKYYRGFDHAYYYSDQIHVGHHYYLDTFLEQVPSSYDYYIKGAFFDVVQVDLNRGYYCNDYHGDFSTMRDLQAPWDPGKLFVTTAWGQAVFQEGRGVSDLPSGGPAADQGPAHHQP